MSETLYLRCPRCRTSFPSIFQLGGALNSMQEGNILQCPTCGNMVLEDTAFTDDEGKYHIPSPRTSFVLSIRNQPNPAAAAKQIAKGLSKITTQTELEQYRANQPRDIADSLPKSITEVKSYAWLAWLLSLLFLYSTMRTGNTAPEILEEQAVALVAEPAEIDSNFPDPNEELLDHIINLSQQGTPIADIETMLQRRWDVALRHASHEHLGNQKPGDARPSWLPETPEEVFRLLIGLLIVRQLLATFRKTEAETGKAQVEAGKAQAETRRAEAETVKTQAETEYVKARTEGHRLDNQFKRQALATIRRRAGQAAQR